MLLRPRLPEGASGSRLELGGKARRPASPTRSRALPAWPRLCDQVKRALRLRGPSRPRGPRCPSGVGGAGGEVGPGKVFPAPQAPQTGSVGAGGGLRAAPPSDAWVPLLPACQPSGRPAWVKEQGSFAV